MLNIIENYCIQNETITAIGQFAVLWGMVEEQYFDKFCKEQKIERIEIVKVSDSTVALAKGIKTALISHYGVQNTNSIYEYLRLRKTVSVASKIVRQFIECEGCPEKEMVRAALFICFRIRNNMFHGEKVFWCLNEQKELIDACSGFLNALLEGNILQKIEIS